MGSRVVLLALFATSLLPVWGVSGCGGDHDDWEVFALDYGRTEAFPLSTAVRGGAKGRKVPFGWYAWLVRKNERLILVDTGFGDKALARAWKFTRHTTPRRLLRELGVTPSAITDVVVTHAHWDHMGDLGNYEKARVWIQKEEFEWASRLVNEKRKSRGGVRLTDVNELRRARNSKRLSVIDGDREIAPGVVLHRGGAHTKAMQWVEVKTKRKWGTVVLATDVAYLYQNIEKKVATGATSDPEGDVAVITQMREVAGRVDLVIPGHDPRVRKRFKAIKKHIYRIE